MSASDDDAELPAEDAPTPRRRWLAIAAVLAIFGLPSLTLAIELLDVSQRSEPSAPKSAPAFTLRQLGEADQTISLATLRGRPVVLNFWASWCVPCRKELPAIERVAGDVKDAVAVVGVNHLDNEQDALEFAKEIGISFPSGYDPGGDTALEYGLFGMPTTVFIDARGRVVGQKTGEISEQELRSKLDQLFGVGDTGSK